MLLLSRWISYLPLPVNEDNPLGVGASADFWRNRLDMTRADIAHFEQLIDDLNV